jgi:hypothetical protein
MRFITTIQEKTSKLHKSYNRTNYAKHTISNSGVDIWNGLDNKYKDIRSLYIFKREPKKYFLLKNNIIYSQTIYKNQLFRTVNSTIIYIHNLFVLSFELSKSLLYNLLVLM